MTADWFPVVVSVGVPVVLGLVGYGVLKGRVEAAHQQLEGKADREVMDVQYAAIISRLERIERKLDANHR